jgi:serine protease AprX
MKPTIASKFALHRRKVVSFTLASAAVASIFSGVVPSSASALPSLRSTGANSASLIVRVDHGHLSDVKAALLKRGAVIDRSLSTIDSLVITVSRSASARAQVENLPGVDVVADDALLQPTNDSSIAAFRSGRNESSRRQPNHDGIATSKRPTATPTTGPRTTVTPTTLPATTVPATTLPATTLPATTVPAATAASTTTAPTTVPVTQVPIGSTPTTAVPTTAVPTTAVSTTTTSPVDPVSPVQTTTPTTTIEGDDPVDGEPSSVAKTQEQRDADTAEKRDEEVTQSRDAGSVESIARVTGARDLWKKGIIGRGVDVALIDSGVAAVPGSPTLVNGVDLSLDAGNANLRFQDGFGHGTHMAGIIAGHDPQVVNPAKAKGAFVGIAPGARVVNVKVGAMDGSVHTSQVIAGLDWVIQNSHANGMNIRVVNLSYGSAATPNWKLDPLAWAAEVAWRRGIVVVAAAGNEGAGHELASPAYSPQILAVGATEIENRRGGRGDYGIAPFTSSGTRRRPDLYVPGAHVVSLRVKGSFVDTFLARSNLSEQLTRGTGTSQATAVTSGLAALLFEAFPQASADQIKVLLTSTQDQAHGKRDAVTGIETSIDLGDAYRKVKRRGLPIVLPTNPFAECGATSCRGIGDGSAPFVQWAEASWNGNAWIGQQWSGQQWSGQQWSGSQWSGQQWSGQQWSGQQWSNNQWSGQQWSGAQWSGAQWSGAQWSGAQWSGAQWSGAQWSGAQWSGGQWSGAQWSGAQWSGEAWSSTWGL